METYKGLPIYEFTIDGEGLAVDAVALVDKPAIKKDFQAFSEDAQLFNFSVQDEERHIISGALMLAETPIFRTDSKRGDFYCKFSKDTIEQIAVKFFENGSQKYVNFMHDGKLIDGFVMFESFITDLERGILPMKGFEDVPNGSWFGSFKVNNDEAWQLIKDEKVKGFSVEGLFNLTLSGEDSFWDELEDILNS